jgi:hypothetical protein
MIRTQSTGGVDARRWRSLALWLLLVGSAGCAGDASIDSPLAHAQASPEALAEAALDALSAGDEAALAALMITRDEYETLLWPDLPDRDQMPFEFVWSITGPRSRKARTRAVAEYRDLPLELLRVELGDDVERYDRFAIHRRSRMWVRRTDSGEEGVLPLMDTLVEMDGGWKFMNFVEDA